MALFPLSSEIDAFARQTTKRRLSTDVFYQPDSISFSGRVHLYEEETGRLCTILTSFMGKQKKALQVILDDVRRTLEAPKQSCQVLENAGIISPSENRQNVETLLTAIY